MALRVGDLEKKICSNIVNNNLIVDILEDLFSKIKDSYIGNSQGLHHLIQSLNFLVEKLPIPEAEKGLLSFSSFFNIKDLNRLIIIIKNLSDFLRQDELENFEFGIKSFLKGFEEHKKISVVDDVNVILDQEYEDGFWIP